MAKRKRLPRIVYVYEETDMDATSYYVCYDDPADCAEIGTKRGVGVYQLVNTAMISTVIQIDPKPTVAKRS